MTYGDTASSRASRSAAINLLGIATAPRRFFVSGRLEARPWTSNQGEVRAGLEVIASDVEFMSSRQQDDERPAPVAARRPAAAAILDEDDDSIPF